MNNESSIVAAGIIQGLKEAIQNEQIGDVEGIRQTIIYRVHPRAIRHQLNMSQREFATAFGIPLSTLKNWEQGRRKIDATSISYLRIISKIPNEVQHVLQTASN